MKSAPAIQTERARVLVQGAVQGVGFRPFVYRLATELQLCGWVLNSTRGVLIEVEGGRKRLRQFVRRLGEEKPPRAAIHALKRSYLGAVGYKDFAIRFSDDSGAKTTLISPDLATCDDCLRELFDPGDRRRRYPFINCTNCGPRFTIIESLPYDRPHTSMRGFTMCAECEREYHDPLDRRFHAQPNACPRCGPQIALWDRDGNELANRDDALLASADRVRTGQVLALKGIGGFQLIVDARNEAAVARLRERKHRDEKPLALMVPSLAAARALCEISELEEKLLTSAEAPIVLLRHMAFQPVRPAGILPAGDDGCRLEACSTDGQDACAASVAPRNPWLGVMLPCSPLHHLLLRELGYPVVATSGNSSNEPICIDEHRALVRLRGIADCYLVHNRPIRRHMDDSVVRVMGGRELVLRRARGFAPLPIRVKKPLPEMLAVGAHLKNTVALSLGRDIFLSQHLGDLETEQAYFAFRRAAADLPRLYEAKVERVASDLHPDYLSSKYAAQMSPTVVPVQHHWAHVAACMAENGLEPPALGVAWDGTGLGPDGTIWGGEFLLAKGASFERVAHLRQFRLPGGDAAIKEPRRAALGVLHETFGDGLWTQRDLLRGFSKSETAPLRQMLARGVNAPLTSSAGRLFDAVAALAGLRERSGFEGQAAMELEFAIERDVSDSYPFALREGAPRVIDWQPAVLAMLDDLQNNEATGVISAKFHNMLVEAIVSVARVVGELDIALSGGCFQNKYLTERAVRRLREEGFQPHWHRLVPPNDGGIALGQIVAASWATAGETPGR